MLSVVTASDILVQSGHRFHLSVLVILQVRVQAPVKINYSNIYSIPNTSQTTLWRLQFRTSTKS